MAKRKRLELPAETITPVIETKSAVPPRARMPIAEVAGEVAGHAALNEVAREMTALREEGRVVEKIALDRINIRHLDRDRIDIDKDEMAALTASIEDRGQQTPIEVVRLPDGEFGLISGLRRMIALQEIGAGEVLALIRDPEDAAAAHVAMVEENEIRAGLSFYERANLAALTAQNGVFPDAETAIAHLFARASSSKRSKIARFLDIQRALGNALRFPSAIPEKLGLALSTALRFDPKLAGRISDALRKTPPEDAAAERRTLERALKPSKTPSRARDEIAPGLKLATRSGRAVFTGAAVDAAFLREVRAWAVSRAKTKTSSD